MRVYGQGNLSWLVGLPLQDQLLISSFTQTSPARMRSDNVVQDCFSRGRDTLSSGVVG